MSNVVLERLRKRFMKQKVLEISDVYHMVRTNSRKTVYRYLKKLDHLSSYTHAGKYYTLKDIPKFDKDGLWYFGAMFCVGTEIYVQSINLFSR